MSNPRPCEQCGLSKREHIRQFPEFAYVPVKREEPLRAERQANPYGIATLCLARGSHRFSGHASGETGTGNVQWYPQCLDCAQFISIHQVSQAGLGPDVVATYATPVDPERLRRMMEDNARELRRKQEEGEL